MFNRTIYVIIILIFANVQAALGQSISARISNTEGYLGEVLTIQVEVKNPNQATLPTQPRSKDFDILLSPGSANPAVSRQQFIINGRVSSSVTYTYTYELRPLRSGRLKVPPFILKDGGRIYRTRPIVVLVNKGSINIDLFCEVIVKRHTGYIGEPIELTLEAWVRKYRQAGIGNLSVRITRQLADIASSRFGVFQDALAENQSYREDRRKAEDGRMYEYYVFMWQVTVYPQTVGPFDFGDITIAWNYPVKLSRDFFGTLQYVGSPRHLRASAKLPTLDIRLIPLEGRPPDFNGAVGRFGIQARAKPTQAPVGDPITLTLVIRGDVPLDRIGTPRLDQVESLTRDFEISGQSLAGELKSDHKVFSLTIRALREDVSEIPPIPMSYFNPKTGKYETGWSKSIPVTITPAQRLALPTGSETNGVAAAVFSPLVETTQGLQANEADVDELLANQSFGFGEGTLAMIAVMPLLYLFACIGTRRSERFRVDVAYRRRRSAYASAKKGLRRAGQSLRPNEAYGLVMGYIADRCNVPAGGLIRADAIILLTERKVPTQTREALNTFLESLEQAQYGGPIALGSDSIASKTREFIDDLEHYDLR